MTKRISTLTQVVRLPAGSYFIGDPAMVLDTGWDAIAASFTAKNRMFTYGDKLAAVKLDKPRAVYTDQNENEFPCDTGCLGIVNIDMIEDPAGEDFGTVISSEEAVEIRFEGNTLYVDWGSNEILIPTSQETKLHPTGHGMPGEEDIQMETRKWTEP